MNGSFWIKHENVVEKMRANGSKKIEQLKKQHLNFWNLYQDFVKFLFYTILILPWPTRSLRNILVCTTLLLKRISLVKSKHIITDKVIQIILINLYSNGSQIYFVYVTCINYCSDMNSDNLTLRDGILH